MSESSEPFPLDSDKDGPSDRPSDLPGTVTRAVNAIARGTLATDLDPTVRRIYDELHQLASSRLARDPTATIQPTDLVHEAFVKLFRPRAAQDGTPSSPEGERPSGASLDQAAPHAHPWQNRRHFFGSAARAMSELLIDRWRKAGPELAPNDRLDERAIDAAPDPRLLSEAIDDLERHSAEIAEIVRLRVFAGLSVEATAEVLGIAPRTVKRRFAFAKAWLLQRMTGGGDDSSTDAARDGAGP